ncbi:toxin TcdB middle/N-terminal domain-containing protein [Methanolobus tindarius]|uniref:toxin TcdB middle/N-terminal domain-containing protein n=1 Tax=Methanolobus tindarius TaxID=2221 RepID=UPI00146FB9DD|nr:toxin TcdB middle/N-terminal domain-containing protein [Methanolobus tindarius]
MLTPNVYCLEDENSYESENIDSNSEQVATQDSSSDDTDNDDTTFASSSQSDTSDTIVTLSSTYTPSAISSPSLVETTTYLNPSFEHDNDYFDTDMFTGSFAYTYPIETVKGIGGMEPQISLRYNSMMAKEPYGMTGNGWYISEYYIMRDVRSTPLDTDDDRFVLDMNGAMYNLVEVNGSYYTETEVFMKISREVGGSNTFGNYWFVTLSDGTQYRFGYNNESEQVNSIDSRNYVSKWWLDSIEDVNGNQIMYHYSEDPVGEESYTYPTSINYNNNISQISFGYTDKPNIFTLYEQGNKVQGKQVLSNITVKSNNTFLWLYDLEYQSVGSQLLLETIGKKTPNQAFPDTVFEYGSGNTGWLSNYSWKSPVSLIGNQDGDNGVRFIDVNGDGLTDILKGVTKYQYDKNHYREAWLNTGSGWEAASSWEPPTSFIQNNYDSSGHLTDTIDLGVRFADVNGDGLIDILRGNSDDKAWLNTGSGWARDYSWEPPIRFDRFDVRLVDVDGDGLVDLIDNEDDDVWINTGSNWDVSNSWTLPVSLMTHDVDCGVRFMDVNGDGLIDILKGLTIYNTDNNHYYGAWLNNGSGWEVADSWEPPITFVKNSYYSGDLISSTDLGVRFADVNGDGLVDILRGNDFEKAWLNNGNGWVRDYSWVPPIRFDQTDVRLVDVNGDGFVDIVDDDEDTLVNICNTPIFLKEIQHSNGAITTVKYTPSTKFDNTGDDTISDLPSVVWVVNQVTKDNGMSASVGIVSITDYTYKNGMQHFNPSEKIEFRGFGEVTAENNYSITKHSFLQDDVLKGIENHTEIWDKNGNLYSSFDMEYSIQELNSNVNLILLENESSILFDGLTQSLNDSIGWSSYKEYDEYDDYGNPLSVTEYGDVDVTGDERYLHYEYVNDEDDWILGKVTHEWLETYNHDNCSESWYFYDDTEDNSDLDKGLLTKVVSWNNNGYNPSVQYAYDTYGNIIEITDAKGSSQTIEYDDNNIYPISIENSLGQKEYYEYNDLGRITKITDSNGVSTDYVYDNLHRISKVIKPYSDENSPSIEYTYDFDGVAPESIECRVIDMDELFDGDGTEANPYKIYDIYDLQAMNNDLSAHYILMDDVDASETVLWNQGNGFAPIYSFEGTLDGQGYSISNLYIHLTSGDYVGLFGSVNGGTIKNVSLLEASITCYRYGGVIAGIVNSGSTISKCHASGTISCTGYCTGGITGINDGNISNSFSDVIVVDSPEITYYNGGLVGFNAGTVEYCYSIGVVDASPGFSVGGLIGGNSGEVSYSYYNSDTSGQFDTGKGIPKTTSEMQIQSTYEEWDFDDIWMMEVYPKLKFTLTQSIVTNPGIYKSIESYDGFGQVNQRKYEGEEEWISQNTTYNEIGLVSSNEIPHFISEAGQSITYQYDPIGRQTIITNTDNTTLRYHYDLENTTITNQNDVNKTLTSDTYGNIVEVCEFNENDTYITGYEYDALNNLIKITPGLNQPTTPPSVYFTYDSLGRKIAMNDPDMGNWTYEYDLNGNLINQTDARGISTLLSYDALDRLTAIDYPNDEDVSFTYDLQYNGTLSQVTRGNVSSSYEYDQRYRALNETTALDGTGYTTSYEYDSMDRVTRITYPDAASVNLTYNAQTLLESVEGVVDNLDYNARNQITTKELSNGVNTTYTYDRQKLLLDRIHTESLQDLNYEFDNVGNILEIEDDVMDSVKTYGYDDLDRLTSADMSVNSVPTYQRDFTYDLYGCIRQVDENSVTISSYEYNLTPFHAPVTHNGNDLVYDANGNLVEDEDFTYVYNDANQLSEVRYSGNNSLVEKYWYDANGQRVKKQNSAGELTYYVNKFYEIENGTATSYFFRDAERIAKQTDEGMEWYLSDHLGSTSLMVDEDGLEVERTEYYPYGEVQSGGLEKYGFTGKENDADTGLTYYGARYYSPEYRIFVQPDMMLPEIYNPQALNRYSYCLTNPVKYNDPSGNVPQLVAAGVIIKIGSAAIDYGWTAYNIKNDLDVIDDPNAATLDKQYAAVDMTLALVFEAAEPDELLPINLPLDDITRKVAMKPLGKILKNKYWDNVLETAAKNAGKRGKIDPQKVRYTQDDIGRYFKNREEGTVYELIEGLKNGNIDPSDIPPIRIYEMDGKIYSIDNRRLYAFKEADINIRYVYATPKDLKTAMHNDKFSSINDGLSIVVRN